MCICVKEFDMNVIMYVHNIIYDCVFWFSDTISYVGLTRMLCHIHTRIIAKPSFMFTQEPCRDWRNWRHATGATLQ